MDAPQSRTALITGATRGIGLEVARQLTAAGLRVFVAGRDKSLIESVCRELGCPGRAADLAAADEAPRLYAATREVLGRVDVLVNNAGFNRRKSALAEVTAGELDESYAVNVRAPILLAREALKDMAERRSGHILNVVSSVVRTSMENFAVYATMKYALHGFTACLIKEARQFNVKVTGVYPGGVNTAFRPNSRPDYMRADSAARMIVHCIMAPPDVVVHELVYRPIVETNF